MDNKFYVPLEVARLLKEKGYNGETIYYYNSAGKLYLGNGHFNHNAYAVNLSAPSKAEAMDWIESNTGFIISEDRRCDGFWYYVIFQGNDIWYDSDCHVNGLFLTRWEAQEAAIIRVLTEFL